MALVKRARHWCGRCAPAPTLHVRHMHLSTVLGGHVHDHVEAACKSALPFVNDRMESLCQHQGAVLFRWLNELATLVLVHSTSGMLECGANVISRALVTTG